MRFWRPSLNLALTNSANRTVINSTIASTRNCEGAQLLPGRSSGTCHSHRPLAASASPTFAADVGAALAQSRLRDGGTKRDGYHRCPKPVLASCQCCLDIAAQGPLCSCAANALMDTRQVPRFAQAAVKSCGSLESLPPVPLNAELVACRTSRKREREY
jgi:hypothetical protein